MRNDSSRLSLNAAAGLVTFVLTAPLVAQDPPKRPIRINDYLGTPDYLRVSGSHRTRFESLNGQFRANNALRNTEDQVFNRSIIRVDYTRDGWGATVEGLDGRAFGTAANSFANTTTVNTFDVLQANASYRTGGHKVTIGRYTMDVGSRRLVARNKYRNTINSFGGVRWDYKNSDRGYEAGAFWSMPTIRRPSDRMMLVDNEHDWDRQSTDYQFWGAHATKRIDEGSTGQVYFFGLDDTRGNRDDQIYTVGGRYFRPSRPGHFFGEFEAAHQFGDTGPWNINAQFYHGSVGYTCDCEMQPSVRIACDIATGNDGGGEFSRFNTLFGARRFEYGPTGIYGAIGRRNIVSPEIRFTIKPTPTTWVMVGWRDIQLETGSDDWVEAGDGSGQGRSVGQQTECRLRWEPCKSNMRFEIGGAYLAGGRFRDTSTANRSSDTRYFFAETIFTF